MGYEIEPRVERKSKAGLVLTRDEMAEAIDKDVRQRGTPPGEYSEEAIHSVRNIAITAEWMGRRACTNATQCELSCTGVSLVEQNGWYAGQVRAVCESVACDDTGVKVAFQEFRRYELS